MDTNKDNKNRIHKVTVKTFNSTVNINHELSLKTVSIVVIFIFIQSLFAIYLFVSQFSRMNGVHDDDSL